MAKCDTIFAVKNEDGAMSTLALKRGYYLQVPGGTSDNAVLDTEAKLKMLKKHVRADDFNDDDEYLQQLLDAAESYVCRATNRTMDELVEMGEGEMPKPLWHAVLLICGHWYNQREAVSAGQMTEVPYTLSALLKEYTKLGE